MGTVGGMPYDLAADLERELEQYAHVDGLVGHIREACGGEGGASLEGQRDIHAYLIRQNENVFSVYALCENGFVVAEMSSGGATLAVWIDLSRVSRIYDISENEERVVGIEVDADSKRIETSGRERGADGAEGWASETVGTSRIIPASYELRGKKDDRSLAWFALRLRQNRP